MNHGKRIFVRLVLTTGLLAPTALAQKPPAPPSPPTAPAPTAPSGPVTAAPWNPSENQPDDDVVTFLRGRVRTGDGTALPNDASIQRVCGSRVRQQVYASSQGDFSMQMRSMADSFVDASGDGAPLNSLAGQAAATMGIPRRELLNCELRASASGFRSSVVTLAGLTTVAGSIDVGDIVVERTAKVHGTALSALPYQAPKDARRAYDRGLDAVRHGRLADARADFEKAVQIYPKYTSAWFQLGTVLEKTNQIAAARNAYTRATVIDARFLPPYLSLAFLACEAGNWAEVVALTGHILDFDPSNQAAVTGYVVDLDPMNFGDAYFYNALANYRLNRMAQAEKRALQAEHLAAVGTRFPQLHLLLADLFSRRGNYSGAISEIQTYLELVPHAKDVDQVREQLAKLEKLNGPVSTNVRTDQN